MRSLSVDEKACIGCCACSNVCQAGLLRLEDIVEVGGGRRSLHISPCCEEDCDLCEVSCPVGAVSLKEGALGQEVVVDFALVPCDRCGMGFVTAPILKRLRNLVPGEFLAVGSGEDWMGLCPSCRRALEREMASRTVSRRL